MPPEGNTQFDLHMHESMHRLHELRSNFKTDIFVSLCYSNIPKGGQTDKQVDPKDIVKRIRKEGYNWWVNFSCLMRKALTSSWKIYLKLNFS